MMLLDKYLPRWDFAERHCCSVAADNAAIMTAIANYRPDDDPIFKIFIGLRELPMRLSRRLTRSRRPASKPFGLHSFTLLEIGEREVVYGLAGEFWKPDFGQVAIYDAGGFLSLDDQKAARLVLGFHVLHGTPNILTTDTRVYCPTTTVRRKFAPYWYLIRPFSGMIRRRILNSIKQAAERN